MMKPVLYTTATITGKTRTVSQFITLMHHFVICINFDELHYKELYVRPQRIPRSCTYEKYGRKCLFLYNPLKFVYVQVGVWVGRWGGGYKNKIKESYIKFYQMTKVDD